MTTFEMPEGNDTLTGTLTEGVELPFEAVYFYWRNGSRQEKSDDILKFGGWAVDKQEADAYLPVIPPTFTEHNMVNRQGNDYSIYGIRNLFVAPIEQRYRWYETNNGSSRSHMQLLAYVSTFADGTMYPLGVHVLTAKGMRTKDMKDHISEWTKVTATLRREHFNNALANYFYMSLGTFGEKPNYEETGHGSVVTPIGLYYKALTEETLLSRYVGKDAVIEMREKYEEASTWLKDWDTKESQDAYQEIANASDEYREELEDFPF